MPDRITITTEQLLANDVGQGLRLVGVGHPSQGGTTVLAGNTLTYTAPALNPASPLALDTFTYTVEDIFGQTATATVSIRIRNPVWARDDVLTVTCGESLTLPTSHFLDNDVGFGLRVSGVGTPARGSATLTGSTLTYQAPPCGGVETDAFTYTVTDQFGTTSTANVAVTVSAPIVANDDSLTLTRTIVLPPPAFPPIVNVVPVFEPATLRQVLSFVNVNGFVNWTVQPELGNLFVAVLVRNGGSIFGDDVETPRARDPLPGWTVLAKSQDHYRMATTLVYRYVDQALYEQLSKNHRIQVFADSPNLAPSSILLWELRAAPTIEEALPAFSLAVEDTTDYRSKPLLVDDPVLHLSTTTARAYTANIAIGGGDHTINRTEFHDFQNRLLTASVGTTTGGAAIRVTACTEVASVMVAARKRV